jgi:hypothetical protein
MAIEINSKSPRVRNLGAAQLYAGAQFYALLSRAMPHCDSRSKETVTVLLRACVSADCKIIPQAIHDLSLSNPDTSGTFEGLSFHSVMSFPSGLKDVGQMKQCYQGR